MKLARTMSRIMVEGAFEVLSKRARWSARPETSSIWKSGWEPRLDTPKHVI